MKAHFGNVKCFSIPN